MARACGSSKKPNPGPAPCLRPSRPFSPVERTPKLLKEGGTRQGHRGGATHAAPGGLQRRGEGLDPTPGPWAASRHRARRRAVLRRGFSRVPRGRRRRPVSLAFRRGFREETEAGASQINARRPPPPRRPAPRGRAAYTGRKREMGVGAFSFLSVTFFFNGQIHTTWI